MNWRRWGWIAVASWLTLFGVSFVSVGFVWGIAAADPEEALSGMWPFWACLVATIALTGIPGIRALADGAERARFRTVPEAASLALLTLSGLLGPALIAGGEVLLQTLGTGFLPSIPPPDILIGAPEPVRTTLWTIGFGWAIGILIFPLTFGIVFPLGIPLGCAAFVWGTVAFHGTISRLAFSLLTALATLGWMGVVLAGLISAQA